MKLCLLAAFLASALPAFSQTERQDTSRAAQAQDSLSRKFVRPIPLVGSLDRFLPEYSILTDSLVNYQVYRYSGDLLSQFPGVYMGDFGGGIGQLNNITLGGMGNGEVAYMADGIPLNDPSTGLFNPWFYPAENIERVEVITGTRAFLYGMNGAGGAVNFLSKSKKAVHPASRLRYTESAYGLGIIDGMISQDILRGLNVTAGAQHATYGERFPNDSYDCWTGRAKVRYNVSEALNFFASVLYNKSQLGLNGGVDIVKTPVTLWYDPLQATMRNTDSYEKFTRTDFQLGVAGRFLPDTEAITTITLYSSSNLREYRDEENRPNPNGIFIQEDQHSTWGGLKLTQEIPWGEHRLSLGAEIPNYVRYYVYGKGDFRLGDPLRMSAYARSEANGNDYAKLSYGGDGSLSLNPCTELFGGYSRSYRFPTDRENITTGPAGPWPQSYSDPERHDLAEAGLRWGSGDEKLSLKAFQRVVKDFIGLNVWYDNNGTPLYYFRNMGRRVLRGLDAGASFRLGSFVAEGTGEFLEEKINGDLQGTSPRWAGAGGVYFWDKLFDGHLNLKAGVRGRVFSSFTGRVFDQHLMAYIPDGPRHSIDATGTGDLVIIAHLGNAYLHFIWDNLLDRQYVIENFYPMPGRQIRFGVSWDFLD